MDLYRELEQANQAKANNVANQGLSLIDRIRGDYLLAVLELSYLLSDPAIDYLIRFTKDFRDVGQQCQKAAQFPTLENRELLSKMILDLYGSHGVFLHELNKK